MMRSIANLRTNIYVINKTKKPSTFVEGFLVLYTKR
jgi:hypothetical protein